MVSIPGAASSPQPKYSELTTSFVVVWLLKRLCLHPTRTGVLLLSRASSSVTLLGNTYNPQDCVNLLAPSRA